MRDSFYCHDCDLRLDNVRLPVRHKCNKKMKKERLLTTADLVNDTLSMVPQLPPLRAIVGIARSGILPASVLATHLGTALYSLDNRTGEVLELGRGRRFEDQSPDGRVLLVDDTIFSGYAFAKACPAVHQHFGEAPLTAATYAKSMSAYKIDFYAKVSEKHWFSWNLFNHPMIQQWAFDLDGVFCRDFAPHEDDDGPIYREMMQILPGNHNRPRKPCTIITARLEKYRDLTEAWLDKQGIPVERLVMGPWATKQEREQSDVWYWKSSMLRHLKKRCFVESSRYGAAKIHELTGIPVVCTDTNEAFYVG